MFLDELENLCLLLLNEILLHQPLDLFRAEVRTRLTDVDADFLVILPTDSYYKPEFAAVFYLLYFDKNSMKLNTGSFFSTMWLIIFRS